MSLEASSAEDLGAQGSSSDIVDRLYEVPGKIADRYSNKDNVSVSPIAIYYNNYGGYEVPVYETKLSTHNYIQETLRLHYNALFDSDISGFCTIVATTALIEYYERVMGEVSFGSTYTYNEGDYSISRYVGDYKDAFVGIYRVADSLNYILPNNGGTLSYNHDEIVTASFDYFDSSKEGSPNYSNIFSKIISETNAGRPMLLNMTNHTVLVAGYRKYQVNYTETTGILWWKKTVNKYAIEGVVIINEGNPSYTEYSYYLEMDIPNINVIANGVEVD